MIHISLPLAIILTNQSLFHTNNHTTIPSTVACAAVLLLLHTPAATEYIQHTRAVDIVYTDIGTRHAN